VDSLSGVEADAHLDLLLGRLCAIAIGERTLHGDGAGQGTAGRDEGGHKAVAERLDLSAAMGLHLLTQEIEMTAHELLSGSIALARLESSRADDIGEEDGDDACGRLLGHFAIRSRVFDEIMHRRGAGG